MREKTGTGAAALDGVARQRCLRESLASQLQAMRGRTILADDKPTRDVFQLLRHILSEGAQGAATGGAGIAWGQTFGLSLKVTGQRSAAVLPFDRYRRLHRSDGLAQDDKSSWMFRAIPEQADFMGGVSGGR